MIFTEVRFLLFFAVVFLVFWSLRESRARKGWLLIASYAFYAAWDYRFLSLILISTLVDYFVGLKIPQVPHSARKRWLLVSVTVNLGLLGFFKYFNFFIESAADLLQWFGFEASIPVLSIVLPVGISFYTFQTMSYTIDVYYGKLEPTKDLLDLALFVGFFPQLVAGPIVRARDFLPQLYGVAENRIEGARSLLLLFLVGYFKKACVSDNISGTVDMFFQNPGVYTVGSAWIAVVLYGVQIYCDFSGYSDMAIATAGLLGFKLPLNFNFPYLASDIVIFWRRWHISLSTWLRDYLYIPLGGNRGSKLFTYRNLMLTMLLGGLWHGAAWRFVIWGGLHGLALVGVREWREFRSRFMGKPLLPSGISTLVGILMTFYWVSIAWIFFRAEDLSTAFDVVFSFVFLRSAGPMELSQNLWLLILVLLLAHVLAATGVLRKLLDRAPIWGFSLAYGAMVSLALGLQNFRAEPFIYFQF